MINKVIIHYLTHHILTNKNSPTEMNHVLRKIKTPHKETLHNQKILNKYYNMNKSKIKKI